MDLTIAKELCKHFEGFRSFPYLCPAGVPTIGYGSTYYMNGVKVTLKDSPITKQQAEEMLVHELAHTFLPAVLKLCPGLAEYPDRLNVIVDFTYNLGAGRLKSSTLRKCINAQDWGNVKEQLMLWTRGGGKVLPGLYLRRKAECLSI
jgi:lysozyme